MLGNKKEWSTDTYCNAACIDFEDIMLTGEASHKRSHTAQFSLYEMSRISKPIEAESGLVIAQGWQGWRAWGMTVKFVQSFFLG